VSAQPGKLVRGVVKHRHWGTRNIIEFTVVVNDVDLRFAEGIPPDGSIVTVIFENEAE
jgi:hypothetical protein